MRGSGEREAGQQRSVSANNGQCQKIIDNWRRRGLKICSRDLAPKSWQLAPVATSLSAQALRADWVTGMNCTHRCPGHCPRGLLPSPCWCARSGLCSLLAICRHCTVSCPGASAAPSTEQTPKPSMLQLLACACLACCLSCHPDLEPGALAAQKNWPFPPTNQASCGVAHAAFSIWVVKATASLGAHGSTRCG